MATMGEMRAWAMNGTAAWREAKEKLREGMFPFHCSPTKNILLGIKNPCVTLMRRLRR